MRTHWIIALHLFLLGALGCGGSTPGAASPSDSAASAGAANSVAPTKPERNKIVAHLKDHVKYPISRADLLNACADSSEFTAGEKRWFETNLPAGPFKSADDAIAALNP